MFVSSHLRPLGVLSMRTAVCCIFGSWLHMFLQQNFSPELYGSADTYDFDINSEANPHTHTPSEFRHRAGDARVFSIPSLLRESFAKLSAPSFSKNNARMKKIQSSRGFPIKCITFPRRPVDQGVHHRTLSGGTASLCGNDWLQGNSLVQRSLTPHASPLP